VTENHTPGRSSASGSAHGVYNGRCQNRTAKVRNVNVNLIPAEDQGVFVLIVLTVRPGSQQALIDTIRAAGDPAQVPGLRSISLLRSLDGTQVINHMHWASQEAYAAASARLPVIRDTRAEVQRLIENAATNIYEAVSLGPPAAAAAAPEAS
jgi:heme-degrading monooxygenase HmoA